MLPAHKLQHVATDTLTCTAPLPKMPPRDLMDLAKNPMPNPAKSLDHTSRPAYGQHSAWAVCAVTRAIDEALIAWKEKFCQSGYNNARIADIHRPDMSAVDPHGAPSAAAASKDGLKPEYFAEPTTLDALKAEQAAEAERPR